MKQLEHRAHSKSEMRKFSWVMASALAIFGALSLYKGNHKISILLWSLGAMFLGCGLFLPLALVPVYRVWMKFAHVLAWINTRIILGLFFYVILTPISILMRVTHRDVLRRKFDRSSSSYWHIRKPLKSAQESYEHLY